MELYGELNQKLKLSTYTGGTTNTATVHVDNETNIITVDSKIDVSKINNQLYNVDIKYNETKKRLTEIEDFVTKSINGFKLEITTFESKLDYFGIKIDEIREDVDSTINTVNQIVEITSALSHKVDIITEELDNINTALAGIYSTLTEYANRFELNESRISNLEEEITEIIGVEFTEIKEHFNRLDATVANIEEIIEAQAVDLANHEIKLSELDNKTDEIESIIVQELRPLEQDVDRLNNRVDLIEINVENINSEINRVDNEINSLNEDVESNYQEYLAKVDEITNALVGIDYEITEIKRKHELLKTDVITLNNKVNTFDSRISTLDSKVESYYNGIQASLVEFDTRIDHINEIIETWFPRLEEKVDNNYTELLAKINSNLERIIRLENTIIDIGDLPLIVEALELRIENLETKEIADFNELKDDISTVNTRLDNIGEVIDEKLIPMETKVNQLDTKIDNVDNKVDLFDTRITEVENKVNPLAERMDTVETEVTEMQEEVGRIGEIVDEKLEPMAARVEALDAKVDRMDDTIAEKLIPLENRMTTVERALDSKADALSKQGTEYWYMMSGGADGDIVSGPYDLGSGGGGGGGTITEVTIRAIDWPTTIAYGAECKLHIFWTSEKSGIPTGNGTIVVNVDGKNVITRKNTPQGDVDLNLTDYLNVGTNTIEVIAQDAYSTFDKVIAQLETVAISLTSTFNSDRVFKDIINYTYIPTASVPKTVYFIVDGVEYGRKIVNVSGESQTFPISGLTHGSHTLDVYFTCEIAGVTVKSQTLVYDLMYEVEGETAPMITSIFNDLEQEQFVAFSIPYRVYTPEHNMSDIELLVNGTVIKSLSVDQETQYWEYRPSDFGPMTLTIKCGTVEKSWAIDVAQSELDVKAVEEDLVLYLTATGRSNAESHPEIWEDEDRGISCDLENFNFVSDGWLRDSDNNTILKVTGDARVTIPYKPFEKDFRSTGKTIELEFSTDTISDYETEIITCYSGDRGFTVTPQIAKIKSQQSSLFTQYKEDEHVRVTFVIEKTSESHLILMYLNGVMSGAYQYPTDDNFRQLDPVNISIGSNDATVNIYCIRIYDNNLNRKQVVNNWIADTQSGSLKAQRYYHNDNYNDIGELVIQKLPSDLPYIIWDINPLPQFKGDKRPGNATYVDPTNSDRNFTSTDATYNVQGTSSSVYPVKNIRTKYKKNKDWPDTNFTWKNNKMEDITKYAITPDGIGDNYFTFKVDYASSEGANNVELVKLYNDAAKSIGVLNPAQKLNNKVRVGIDGYPVVAYHKDDDGNIKFCTKANFNNDKANEAVYGFVEGDESWEVTNNSADEGNFKKPATPETFGNAFEIRYPDEDGYSDLSKLGPMTEWVVSTTPEQATEEELPSPIVFTYTTVVRSEDGSYSTRTVTSPEFTHDTAEYRKIKFKAELKDWFDINSTVFYYIFTHLYLMVDSRAKNAFPTYFVSRQAGDGGNKWFWLPYDMDTAIGINNEGKLVFDYSLEDVDQVEGANVFNGQNSTLWCNLREMFDGEIGQMYSNLRTSGSLLSFDETENRFEAHQNKWSENIFNEDSYQKYINVLIETGDNYLEMLQGSKAEQRKWWLYNRFKYFDSKYLAGEAKSDVLQFRAYAKADVTLTPYADIYATVSYANTAGAVVSVRAKRGESYTLPNPLPASASDQETYIYSASQLKYVGDLSPFKPDTVKAANAIRLQELIVGSGADGYVNPNLRELSLGKNVLLKKLDVRNCINLTNAIDIRNCTNIEEVYFDNTRITGLQIPVGGILKKLHLPDTLTNLTIRNQKSLEELVIAGTENVQTLWLENIPSSVIDAQSFIMGMAPGSAVRVIGFENTFDSVEDIEELYDLLDTMKGINAQGEDVDKAQISGKIHIATISYADWVRLSNRYKDIQILAETIVCKVTFMNEDEVFNIQNVIRGNNAFDPGIPEKEETAQFYYTFENWDKEFTNIQEDIEINAVFSEHIQTYEIKFNTQSTLVHVDSQFVDYGQKVTRPIDPAIPGVDFLGWFNEAAGLNEYDFDTLVTGPDELFAKWHDVENPIVVEIERESFNKFTFTATDNLGIDGYAITNSAEDPTEWIEIEPITPLIITNEIEEANTYYVWVKDGAGNKAHKFITAYKIDKDLATGSYLEILEDTNYALECTIISIAHTPEWTKWVIKDKDGNNYTYNLSPEARAFDGETPIDISTLGIDAHIYIILDEDNIIVEVNLQNVYRESIDDFAIETTPMIITSTLDIHYENNVLILNDETQEETSVKYTIDKDTTIKVECNPKTYHIEFNNGRYGDKPEDQFIVYKNLVARPRDQFISGMIIEGWYREKTFVNQWNFATDTVSEDMVLYANWVTYIEPSLFTIQVDDPSVEYTANWNQSASNGVKVEWGDDTDFEMVATTGNVFVKHTYAEAGTYVVKITCTNGWHNVGGGFDRPVISPASSIINVEFAYNMSYTTPYCLQGATSLTSVELTRYMSEIAVGMFYGCTNLTEVIIPNTISAIGSQAFFKCPGFTGEFDIPNSISRIGSQAFYECTGITKFNITDSVKSIEESAFAKCTLLEEITIPESITVLENALFQGCTSLVRAEIPEYITLIKGNLFNGCTALEKVILNSKDTLFEAGINFNGCDLLVTAGPIGGDYNIEFAWEDEIPDHAFEVGSDGISKIASVIIPDTVTRIGSDAFTYCRRLRNVVIPEGVTRIEDRAFWQCETLQPMVLPETLKYIGSNAFFRCYAFKEFTIPANVEYIGPNIFAYDFALKNVYIYTPNSDYKVDDYINSWFISTTFSMMIHIPRIVAEPEVAYGMHWNYYNEMTDITYIADL